MEYTISRGQKIGDVVSPSTRIRVSVPDPAPIQPSKVEIVKLGFAFERLEMEQKYFRLQEMANKAKSNARVHERKAQRMADVYTKAKSENENLYIAKKAMGISQRYQDQTFL